MCEIGGNWLMHVVSARVAFFPYGPVGPDGFEVLDHPVIERMSGQCRAVSYEEQSPEGTRHGSAAIVIRVQFLVEPTGE